MWARPATGMCQSSDCQLASATGHPGGMGGVRENKENFDWNNNSNNNNNNNNNNMLGNDLNGRDDRCQCMMQRRTRRRHPATIQTPGREEVGEVYLEPLVSGFNSFPMTSSGHACADHQDLDLYPFPSPAHSNQGAVTAFSPPASSGFGGSGFWHSGGAADRDQNQNHFPGAGGAQGSGGASQGWPALKDQDYLSSSTSAGSAAFGAQSSGRPIGSSRSSSLPIPFRNSYHRHHHQHHHHHHHQQNRGMAGFFSSTTDPRWQRYEEYEESGSAPDSAEDTWPRTFKSNVLH